MRRSRENEQNSERMTLGWRRPWRWESRRMAARRAAERDEGWDEDGDAQSVRVRPLAASPIPCPGQGACVTCGRLREPISRGLGAPVVPVDASLAHHSLSHQPSSGRLVLRATPDACTPRQYTPTLRRHLCALCRLSPWPPLPLLRPLVDIHRPCATADALASLEHRYPQQYGNVDLPMAYRSPDAIPVPFASCFLFLGHDVYPQAALRRAAT